MNTYNISHDMSRLLSRRSILAGIRYTEAKMDRRHNVAYRYGHDFFQQMTKPIKACAGSDYSD